MRNHHLVASSRLANSDSNNTIGGVVTVFSALFPMRRVLDYIPNYIPIGLGLFVMFLILLKLGCADRFARTFLFHPTKLEHDLPEGTFREVRFQNSQKQTLHGIFFPYQEINPDGTPVGTILFFHGNADNLLRLIGWGEQMRRDFRCNVLIFSYAGYGKSEGRPTAPGVLDDGRAALNHLIYREKIPVDQIILYGFSLGGAVAIDLASRYEVKGLIVESTFTSLADMGRQMIPFFPAELFLWEQLASIDKIGNVRSPVFISHGRGDRVVPFSQGERLFEAAKAAREKTFFIPPEGLDFHSAPHSGEHSEALRQFIGSL
jgi:pimeloyl-ACP methyl ester carboxylesterase